MKKLYIVFDQLPSQSAGGLVATYLNLAQLLKNHYEIHIISVFNYEKQNHELFLENKKHIINHFVIDNRFFKIFDYMKKGKFKKVGHAIVSCFYYFLSTFYNRIKIKKLIKEQDLVIVSSPAAAMFMPKKVPFILEIHSNYSYFFGENIMGRIQAHLMRTPTLTLFRTKYDSTHAPQKLNPNYIYNFYDNQNSKISKRLVKNKILFVGRINEIKNPIRLLEIAFELKKRNPNFTLDIYGTGELEDCCIQKIKELDLEKNVFMRGFTTDKNIYSKYSMLWLTSKSEGLPMVIIEAKACGIPTISTNWGNSICEVIEDGVNGYIVNTNKEFAKKANEILTNTQLQKTLSKNAANSFEPFTKDKAKTKWITILENYQNNTK